MNSYLSFLAISYFIFLMVVFYVDNKISRRDVFSPGKMLIYFSALNGLSLLWMATTANAIDELIFSTLDIQFHRMDLVYQAYAYTIFGFFISYIGITAGNRISHPYMNACVAKLIPLTAFNEKNKQPAKPKIIGKGLMVFIVGLIVYFIFIQKMGGIYNLWENLNERVERAAGLGYVQIFYSYSVVFGALLIIYSCILRRRFLLCVAIITITVIILASLGQRGPVAEFIFALIVLYHYKIKRIRNVLSPRNLIIGVVFIVFMLLSVQFRTAGALEKYQYSPSELFLDALNSFERHVIARFGRLERDIAILGYFESHEIWWGASYYSLVTAPVPRNLYTDKPPVDTGRYLLAIAEGEIINPPVPVTDLPSSSWPDANWAGYMNFYIPGFIATYFLSGFILGFTFQHLRFRGYPLAGVIFYGMFSWGGCPVVSPMGIVSIVTDIGVLAFWCYFFMIFKSKYRVKEK